MKASSRLYSGKGRRGGSRISFVLVLGITIGIILGLSLGSLITNQHAPELKTKITKSLDVYLHHGNLRAGDGRAEKSVRANGEEAASVQPGPTRDAPSDTQGAELHEAKEGFRELYRRRRGDHLGTWAWLEEAAPAEVRGEVTEEMRRQSDEQARRRRGKVRDAMRRVWGAYRQHAWGHDELKPISLEGDDNWGGIGCTLVDSLDTLWLLGLRDEFWEARDWVRDHLSFEHVAFVSLFEVTIRELGGLLSAYDLSGDKVFLSKAKDLGERLLMAFDTPSGVPMGLVNLQTGESKCHDWTGGASIISEFGTLQMEFRYLSEVTGDPKFAQKVNRVFDLMASKQPPNGLYPTTFDTTYGRFRDHRVSFGGLGDSFYEYMLKVWLQGGRKEPEYRRMFDGAMDGMMKEMLKRSKPSGLPYVSDSTNTMEELVCFLPAVLALGAVTLPEGDSERAVRYMAAAEGLTYTCYQMWHRHPTHLAPEITRFVDGQDMLAQERDYRLRPETAEALFYLHEITGHPIYREWAWEIFQGIEQYCRTQKAYGTQLDVTNANGQIKDRMESFFLGETLKYLYLIQDPDHPIDLQKHVFNTEAHPLRMFDAPPGRLSSRQDATEY